MRLSNVLQTAGVEEEARYVAFLGLDQAQVAGDLVHFGSSIRNDSIAFPCWGKLARE
ncbi:hypothetical protein [Ktedonobacter racemifer]|uniref:hypothetical protein n=1 Tax=Ktedonobacter racemifer TaxID=363277 RepID=UPI0012F782D7|nr:hypothetical protein [Ktedonobacter racemifer]